jgi:cytoskeleton protein RodZ
MVIFKPTAESWVEVTDAKGAVLLRRKLVAGEVAGATGALPLSAIVGRADVTQVQVRGQAFDLTPVTRDNVARFEVK